MIKVLIADDEEKVCTLIRKLVNWQDFDMEVVATAANGIEALECITTHGVDVVITDIRMPGYDGIELIAKAKALNDRLEFIIISGYRHFEYAQSAIKYGVSDYLLKPIKKAELTETLKKIRLQCLKRAEQLSLEEQLRLRLRDDTSKRREQLFGDLFDSPKPLATLAALNQAYCFGFVPGMFQFAAVKIDCRYEDFNPDSLQVLVEKIHQILDALLRESCSELEVYAKDAVVYTLLNYAEANAQAVRRQFKAVMAELVVQQTVFDGFFFTLCTGKPLAELQQLPPGLRAVRRLIDQRLVEGVGKIIDEAVFPEYTPFNQEAFLGDFRRRLAPAVELLDLTAALAAVDVLAGAVSVNEKTEGSAIYKLVLAAGALFMVIIKNSQFQLEIPEATAEQFKVRLALAGTTGQLFESLKLLIDALIDFVTQERKQVDTRPIRLAKEYIRNNYMNPIGLEEISAQLGFNLSYFSVLFKKETGKNFVEYLTEVRIANAKELLRETSLSIAEICTRVGYLDQKHFNATFKKYAGIKPGEFRKLYS